VKQPAMPHYAGVDWATRTHAVCVVDAHGAIRARFEVPNTGKSFTGLCKRLAKLAVAGVAIERPDGPLVEALMDHGLKVVVITPRQVKALRSRYRASGAKSDPADAYVLADVLRTDGHRLRPLTPDSDPTKVLRALTRTRKDLQEARVALVNQLTSQLERCFPGAIGLFAELHTPVAVAFLRRYPTSHAAATLTQARLAAFLRRLHYPGRTPVATLLSRIQTAPAAGISPAEAAGRAICVHALLDAIQACARQERDWKPSSSSASRSTPTSTSSPRCPEPATASAPRRCWPSSAMSAPASPTTTAWPRSAGLPRSPSPPANGGWSSSAGRVTKSCATRSSTSPTTPATPPRGQPRSMPRRWPAPDATPTPCASWPGPGSG
jgi:Transposase